MRVYLCVPNAGSHLSIYVLSNLQARSFTPLGALSWRCRAELGAARDACGAELRQRS